MIKIAVIGHGVVGSGVVEVFYKNRESIEKKAGQPIDIKYILDLRDFDDSPYKDKFIKDFSIILNDDEISVVVEVMGGLNPAFDFVTSCLLKGKSVVTSNKELVAAKGAEILKIAKENHVNFFFEASVGGGIPIIRPLHLCLAANEINEVAGILNGTTNFILTKMIKEKMSFDDALKLAQSLGYAERNPAADIEGHDTCRKICILASLSFGKHVYSEYVYTEGITKITLEDVEYAKSWGGTIKLIGRAKKLDNDKVQVMVSPAFVSSDCQLSSVNDVYNAIMVRGDAIGDVIFYGRGAGALPTASAVIADVVDIIKNPDTSLSLSWSDCKEDYVANKDSYAVKFYVRATSNNIEILKTQIENLFGEISVLNRSTQTKNEFAFVTPIILEKDFEDKLEQLKSNGLEVMAVIRVLDY